MRKRVSVILALCLAVVLLAVSCDPSSLNEELVSVAFDKKSSRAISASIPDFNPNDYYWYYAAEKADGSNLVSGKTTTYDCSGAVAIRNDGQEGLGSVNGFSQGYWNFKLFAYKTVPTIETMGDFVYSGETKGVLLKRTIGTSNENKVNVIVSPVSDPQKAEGTLQVDIHAIIEASTPQLGTIDSVFVGYAIPGGTVTPTTVTGDSYSVDVAPGAYLVKVVLVSGGSSFSGSVVATIYSQLTTVVGGSIVGTVVGGN